MVIGIRPGSSPFPWSTSADPNGTVLVDPVQRRAVQYIQEVVPTLQITTALTGMSIPADKWYSVLGFDGTSILPVWLNSTATATFGNWDATEKRFYAACAGGYLQSPTGAGNWVYYGGFAGMATNHAPKNFAPSKLVLKARARIGTSAAAAAGIGFHNGAGTAYNVATNHAIWITRGSGGGTNLLIYTGDGTTISSTDLGAIADSNWHDYVLEWTATGVAFYRDGTLLTTKTTNLPTRPLHPLLSGDVDVSDLLFYWD